MIILRCIKRNGLYFLLGTTIIGSAFVAQSLGNNMEKLWHLILGHVSERGMSELNKQGCFGKNQLGKLEFCENCVYGKSCRVKFSKVVHNTHEILNYIHSDLLGPSRVPSHRGSRYFMPIIDDYSRRIWVIIIKNKNDDFTLFKDWKTMIENQTWKKD